MVLANRERSAKSFRKCELSRIAFRTAMFILCALHECLVMSVLPMVRVSSLKISPRKLSYSTSSWGKGHAGTDTTWSRCRYLIDAKSTKSRLVSASLS